MKRGLPRSIPVTIQFPEHVGVAMALLAQRRQRRQDDEQRRPEITCIEEVNREALERLHETADTDPRFTSKGERTKFKRYAKRLLGSEQTAIVVRYFPAKGKQSGRYTAEGGQSIGMLSKWIRRELARGIYHDVDMANCHPRILIHKCEHEWGIACPKLRYYVENRQQVLERINRHNVKKAKNIMLQLMYGCQSYDFGRMDPFVGKYARELERIARCIAPESIRDNRDAIFSHFSIVIQHEEHRLLMLIRKRLEDRWDMHVGVIQFDGLMVRRAPNNPEGPLDEAILQDCQAYIRECTGMPINLAEKPI